MARPEILYGTTYKFKTGCGNMYVTINRDGSTIQEVFAQLGKTGGCQSSQAQAIGRLSSLGLRHGVPVEKVIEQLSGISCDKPAWGELGKTASCADAIAQALRKEYNNIHGIKEMDFVEETPFIEVDLNNHEAKGEICPQCQNILIFAEGCMTCHSCGWSKCS